MKTSLILAMLVTGAGWPIAGLATPGQSAPAQVEMEYGDAWAELGNYKRAVVHYQKAVEQQPKLITARLSLANALFRLGEKEKALGELKGLQKMQPRSVAVACALGVIELDVGKPKDACRSFQLALSLDKNHDRSLFGNGQCHHALFDSTKKEEEKKLATLAYQSYLQRFPKGPHAIAAKDAMDRLLYGSVGKYFAEAKDVFAKGKYRLAEKLLRKVVSQRDDLQEAHYLLGMTLASPVFNRMEEAEQEWRKAGKMTAALLQRGILAYEEEDLEEAEDLLKQAVQLDPGQASAFYYLGLVYSELHNKDEARTAFQRVMAVAPKSALAERASSKLQVMTGQLRYLREGETIDTASEIELGRKISGQLEDRFGLVDDQELQKRLNLILRNISRHSDRPPAGAPYRVKLLNVEGINALSFIGGTIYLYKGLVDFIRRELDDSDDAYAAVIGHEVVHVVMRHGLGMLDLIGGTQSLLEGRSFDVRSLNKLMVGMSRIHEYEADHVGCLYSFRAGYDPAAAYRFHRALIAKGKEVPEGLDHPTHAERSDRLREYLLGLRTKAKHFDIGLKALDEDDFESAITHFEIFLGLFPSSWSARNNLGVAMHRLALATKKDKRDYKLSTDIDPRSHIKPIRMRGEEQAIDEALMMEAAEVFRSVYLHNPDYLPSEQNYGSSLLALGKRDEARKIFEKVLRRSPDSPEARSNLAVLHLMGDEVDKGIEQLLAVVRDHPRFADAYYNLALAYQKSGKKEDARTNWLAYLARDKSSGWAKSAKKHLAELE